MSYRKKLLRVGSGSGSGKSGNNNLYDTPKMTAEQQKVADQINSGSIKTYSGAVEALKTLGISTGGLADQKTYMQAKKSGDLPAAYAKCGNYTEYVQLYLALALPS